MGHENYSVCLHAENVSHNVQKVIVNCSCQNKLDALRSETDQLRHLILENKQLLKGLSKAICEDASVFASLKPASVSASASGENLKIFT